MIIDTNNIYDLISSQIGQIILKLNDALNVIKGRKQTISKIVHFEKHKHNCPYCNVTIFIKYGQDNGVQNYICKECLRKFNDLTRTNRLTYEQIDTFIACFNDKVSIR